ncbi:MAG: hypothetical protein ABSF44_16270 [Candidatus Bathyarchaeia archaeon]|jgi:hypothetical protein
MFKKIKSATLALIITFSLLMIMSQNGGYASTNNPSSLKIYIGPTSVLADNNSYTCIFVQLLDSSGKPARAIQDTTIGLSSSLISIGTVQSSITIPQGATYVSAEFHSTFSPGTTTIAATASGFSTVQTSITTVGYIPSVVAVYGFPSTLPADGNTYNAIMVQLQDSSGAPAKAPKGGVQVTLSCSDAIHVGNVTSSVVILEGGTYATASFTTVVNYTKVQTAIVTSLAQGYSSQQLTITTTPVATNPTQLKIYAGPPQVPADENSYPQVAVELQNATGCASILSTDTSVSIASTDPTVGQIDSQMTIPAGQTYSVATLNTTYKAGTTTITAVATSMLRSQQAITTTGFTPSKLAIFCVPSMLPSDNATYSAIQVQLQDSQGRPAKDPTQDVTVNLFSSTPTVGSISSTLTIPFGQTQATGTLTVTNSPGSTSITAQASSYITGQATMTTYLIDFLPLQITLRPDSQSLNNGDKTNITASITANGAAVTGATIQFTSDSGGTFTKPTDEGNGYYTTTFTASSFTKTTTCTITATASRTGYANSQTTTQITVQPPTSTSTSNSTATSNSTQSSSKGAMKIQLLIQNSQGKALSDVNVSSTVQPEGVKTLSGATNSTGYIVFQNATAGNYTFSIIKKGYYQTFEHVDMKSQPFAATLTLLNSASNSTHSSPLPTILVAVVAIVVGIIVFILVLKRRGSNSSDEPTSTF